MLTMWARKLNTYCTFKHPYTIRIYIVTFITHLVTCFFHLCFLIHQKSPPVDSPTGCCKLKPSLWRRPLCVMAGGECCEWLVWSLAIGRIQCRGPWARTQTKMSYWSSENRNENKDKVQNWEVIANTMYSLSPVWRGLLSIIWSTLNMH